LPYYSVFAADILFYAMTLTFDPVTTTFDYDLEHLQCIACDVIKLCTKFERNRATTYPCQNYSFFDADTLCHAVTFTFDLLTLNFNSTLGVMR